MIVHLIDGTYELFRHYYALPSRQDADGNEAGALVGVVTSVMSLIRGGATHLGVATDHVVESFRNEMFDGYKTGDGMEPDLWEQFHPLEDALRALGVVVWPMTDQEADDALAAAAARAHHAPGVERVLICTPDKDLAQCVRSNEVVQFDRRRKILRNEADVWMKFGVGPASIPDYLALVGDTADGIPGIPRFGPKSAAGILSRYTHLEHIPRDASRWEIAIRGATALATSLTNGWEEALLYRDLATLRTDADVFDDVEQLRWQGPTDDFAAVAEHLGVPELATRAARLADQDHSPG